MAYSKDEAEKLDKPVQPRFNSKQLAQIDRLRGGMSRATWIRNRILDVLADVE